MLFQDICDFVLQYLEVVPVFFCVIIWLSVYSNSSISLTALVTVVSGEILILTIVILKIYSKKRNGKPQGCKLLSLNKKGKICMIPKDISQYDVKTIFLQDFERIIQHYKVTNKRYNLYTETHKHIVLGLIHEYTSLDERKNGNYRKRLLKLKINEKLQIETCFGAMSITRTRNRMNNTSSHKYKGIERYTTIRENIKKIEFYKVEFTIQRNQ